MSCCGTLQLSTEPSCCGSLRPTVSQTPVPPATLGAATTVTAPGGDAEIARPFGVTDGSVLVAAVGHNDGSITPPTGFVKYGDSANYDIGFAGFNWEQEVFVKLVPDASAEPATYTWGGGGYTDVWLVSVHDVDQVAPVADITSMPAAPATGTSSVGASVTATRDGSLLLRFESTDPDDRSAGPAGMSALPGSPFDVTFHADSLAVDAGDTGDKDSTFPGTETWVVHMVVLQPEAP